MSLTDILFPFQYSALIKKFSSFLLQRCSLLTGLNQPSSNHPISPLQNFGMPGDCPGACSSQESRSGSNKPGLDRSANRRSPWMVSIRGLRRHMISFMSLETLIRQLNGTFEDHPPGNFQWINLIVCPVRKMDCSLMIVLFEVPGVPDHVIQCQLSRPAQFRFGPGGVREDRGHIAGATGGDGIGDLDAVHRHEAMNQL